jgi:hypothetical protein
MIECVENEIAAKEQPANEKNGGFQDFPPSVVY